MLTTSLPAPGSETPTISEVLDQPCTQTDRSSQRSVPYAHIKGSSVNRPKYFFFCSSVPAKMIGALASPLASIAVWIPASSEKMSFSRVRRYSREIECRTCASVRQLFGYEGRGEDRKSCSDEKKRSIFAPTPLRLWSVLTSSAVSLWYMYVEQSFTMGLLDHFERILHRQIVFFRNRNDFVFL